MRLLGGGFGDCALEHFERLFVLFCLFCFLNGGWEYGCYGIDVSQQRLDAI